MVILAVVLISVAGFVLIERQDNVNRVHYVPLGLIGIGTLLVLIDLIISVKSGGSGHHLSADHSPPTGGRPTDPFNPTGEADLLKTVLTWLAVVLSFLSAFCLITRRQYPDWYKTSWLLAFVSALFLIISIVL